MTLDIIDSELNTSFNNRLPLLLLTTLLLLPLMVNTAHAKKNNQSTASSKERKLAEFEIKGVNGDVADAILQNLEIEDGRLQPSIFGFAPSQELVVRKAKLALKVFGYYQPAITLDVSETKWIMTVSLGSQVTWNQVKVELQGAGAKLPAFKKIVANHPLKTSKPINHEHYQKLKKSLEIKASELGFFKASFLEQKLLINTDKHTADVRLIFDTKQRYLFRQLSLSGSALSDEFLASLILIKEQSPYLQSAISKTHQALVKSAFFENVVVTQDIDDEHYQVDIDIKLQDIERFEFRSSIGYGSDTGAKVSFKFSDRQFNSEGHRYHWQFDANEIAHSLGVQYYIPTLELDDYWVNRVSYKVLNEPPLKSKTTELESRYVDQIDPFHLQQFAITVGLESLTVNDEVTQYLEYAVPSWRYQYSSVESPLSVDNGWKYVSTLRFSHESISDPDLPFTQLEQALKHVWTFESDYRWINRIKLGATAMSLEDFEAIMPSQYRYFVGGDRSLRGFKYHQLAPFNQNNEQSGGRHFLELSTELERKLNDQWSIAIFADRGQAFNDWNNTKLESSLGFGIRWLTPIGSVKLDIAKPRNADFGSRIHLTIAPDL